MSRRRKSKKTTNGCTSKPQTSLPLVKSKQRMTPRSAPQLTRTGKFTQNWIVEDLLEEEKFVLNPRLNSNLSQLKKLWKNGKPLIDNCVELDPSPFKHCVVKNLLKDESHLDDLCKELPKLPYKQMLNDLYSLQQSCVLDVGSSLKSVHSIVKFIKGPLKKWVQEITGRVFSDKMTITASQYKFTDRLLCHDDNLHDRSVAFILYLCKDWEEEFGGSLDLFDCDSDNQPKNVIKSIFPSFGSFAFFEVSHNSYHQVAEVLTSKSVRLSINGWYHGEDLPQQPVWHGTIPKMLVPIQLHGKSADDFINSTWLNMKTCSQVKSSFEQELSISLPQFLKSPIFTGIEKALKDKSIVWESCGPAHHKRYEVARLSTLPAEVTQFLKFVQSKHWFRFLSQCTVEISPDVKPLPKCWLEVQRWQPGDYTVLFDNDPLNNSTGIDVHLYFGVEKRLKNNVGGEVFYLGPDRDDEGNLEQAFHLEPENNTSTIIAHIEGMAVLTKYLDHRNKPFFKIFGRYSQSVE